MRIIIGGQYYSTPDGSSVRISKSMSDPVPTCALNIVDNTSAITITPPQEILVLDEQVYPNPAVNMLRNPQLNPYNGNGWTAGGVGTNSQNGGGGLQAIFSNAPTGQSNTTLSQLTPFNGVIPGQTYTFSYYASGTGISNIQLLIEIFWQTISGIPSVTNTQIFAIAGGTNRYSITAVCPVGTVRATLNVGINATNATNNGTIIYTQMQLEPNWFPTLAYPTPWVGPNQTNCQQLPLGLYIRQYRKFAGFVTKVSPGDYRGIVRTIAVSAAGYSWLCDTSIGPDTFSNKTDTQVITSLTNKYLTSNGTAMCTLTNVITGITANSTQLNWDSLRTAFDALCGLSGFYWTIDYYWNFIYAPPGYFSMPIALICDNSSVPDMVTTFPAYNFKPEYDFTQPGCNILVIGNGTNVAQVIDPSRITELGILTGYFLPTTTSWMRKINDSTLASVSDCTQRGMAELIQYDNVRGIYHLSANVELLAGYGIRVTSNTDNLNQTTLLLQQVTASWLGTSETLTDVWEYAADLGAVNRAVTNIISRIFRQTQKNTSAPAVSTTTLAVLENVGVIDQVDGNSLYAEAILADSPVAYWRLGEPAGFSITTAYDWGGSTTNGTYTGGFTLGQPDPLYNDNNTAVAFDGSTGYISIPNGTIAANHDLTVEMWVYVSSFAPDGASVQRRLYVDNIDGTNAFQLSLQTPNQLIWAVNDSTGQVISSHAGFLTNTWYHVVGTWLSGARTTTLYVNAVAYPNNDVGASGFGIGSSATNIARRTDNAGYFPGALDEVAIYNTVISPQHILTHYIAGTTAMLNPIYATTILGLAPLAYYRLGEPSGTTAADSTTNANNGTITGTMKLGQPGAIALDFNGAMLFDGSTAYITLPSGVNGNGLSALSVELWFYLSTASLGSFSSLIASGTTAANTGYQLFWSSNTALNFVVGNGTTHGQAAFNISATAEAWVHVVGVYDGATARMYINGVQRATASLTGAVSASLAPVVGATTGHSSLFPGEIDEVSIYSAALTAAQVTQHYNIGLLGHA